MSDKRVIFVSGFADFDVKEFTKSYAPALQKAIDSGCNFVVGDCQGVDAFAQFFLAKQIPEDQHQRVKVFYKGDTPQYCMSKDFAQAGGFYSHEEAAVAMTLCSEEDLAFITPGREGSMTALNILRRHTMDFPYLEVWAKKKNRNVAFWSMVTGTDEC